MRKLDHTLRVAAHRIRGSLEPEVAAHLDRVAPLSETLRVCVEFRGDPRDLIAAGFALSSLVEHPHEGYKIATGAIRASRLEALAEVPHVVIVSAPQRLRPLLNYTADEIGARAVQAAGYARYAGKNEPRGATGRGVIVAIIDFDAVDYRHSAFRKVDRTSDKHKETLETRILAIWDQSSAANTHGFPRPADPAVAQDPVLPDPSLAGDDPLAQGTPGQIGPLSLVTRTLHQGILYDAGAINTALKGKRLPLDIVDKAHGTSVAGIAAGNGFAGECCSCQHEVYVGIAPEADIVAVKLVGGGVDTSYLIDALSFVVDFAASRPLVINISLGTATGAHDGGSAVERAIDAYSALHPNGLSVVVSAGNGGGIQRSAVDYATASKRQAEQNSHVTSAVPAGGHMAVPFFFISAGRGTSNQSSRIIEFWYPGSALLAVEVATPSGARSKAVAPDPTHADPNAAKPQPATTVNLFAGITIASHNALGADGRYSLIRISIPSKADGGTWTIHLTDVTPGGAQPVPFHAWMDREHTDEVDTPMFLGVDDPLDDPKSPRASPDSTLTIPACARSAIVVSSYQSQSYGSDTAYDTDKISNSSARGPVLSYAGGTNIVPADYQKPDVTAPGRGVTSPTSNGCNLPGKCCDCCCDCCACGLYDDDDGTSVAAPHVAGTIALMLELNPKLTREQIVKVLANPSFPGFKPKALSAGDADSQTANAWGKGKLDAGFATQNLPLPPSGGGGGGGGGPTIQPTDGVVAGLPPALRVLRARVQALPDGPLYARLVSRHFSEVRRLINRNRKVATMWHRGEGPRLFRRLVAGAVDENAEPPLESEEQREYVRRLLLQLTRWGSAGLRESVERYGDRLVALLERPVAAQALAPEGG